MYEPLSLLRDRFSSHVLDAEGAAAVDAVRTALHQAALTIDSRIPPGAGRERAIVMTKLEEAMFWANAGISRWNAQ